MLLPFSFVSAQTAPSPTLPENFSPNPGATISINDNTEFKWNGPKGKNHLCFLYKEDPSTTHGLCITKRDMTNHFTMTKNEWMEFITLLQEKLDPTRNVDLLKQDSLELEWLIRVVIMEDEKTTKLDSKPWNFLFKEKSPHFYKRTTFAGWSFSVSFSTFSRSNSYVLHHATHASHTAWHSRSFRFFFRNICNCAFRS